ncbi:MAG: hypothetical protein DRR19_02620 [Candidatus Parabeggiatoa sp. nov. 1]|nr:MAG: hypothetical protein DRR19_02620 [Gammaproteobacteria bacterium]
MEVFKPWELGIGFYAYSFGAPFDKLRERKNFCLELGTTQLFWLRKKFWALVIISSKVFL